MRFLLFALLLIATPAAAADNLFSLYAGGRYDDAIRAGAAAGTADGLAIAARAALADAAMRPQPCLDCLKRAEDFARRAVVTDPDQADGHVWLAAALGLEGRIVGLVRARLANSPAEAKTELDAALKDDPANPYALAALGGWHIEIVRMGGDFLARRVFGAEETLGLALFDRAVKLAPGNVAVHYQIALSLAGYDRTSSAAASPASWTRRDHATRRKPPMRNSSRPAPGNCWRCSSRNDPARFCRKRCGNFRGIRELIKRMVGCHDSGCQAARFLRLLPAETAHTRHPVR